MDKKTMMRSSVPRFNILLGGGAVSFFLNLFESIERREYQSDGRLTCQNKNDWRNVWGASLALRYCVWGAFALSM